MLLVMPVRVPIIVTSINEQGVLSTLKKQL
jgi:hypothetical protein